MTDRAKRILEQALELPEDERTNIVEQLLSSFDAGVEQKDIDEAWRSTVARRSKEIEEGTVRLLSWQDVRAMTQKRTGQ